MDFERLKQNLRLRSGRTSTNMSKRFPTREPEREHGRIDSPETLQLNPSPRRKTKPSTKNPPLPTQTTRLSNPQFDAKNVTVSSLSQKSAPVPQNGNMKGGGNDHLDRKSSGSDSGEADYDLRPPPPATKYGASPSLEGLSELLFSEGYLKTLTNDAQLLGKFTGFLDRYKPEVTKVVLQYLETQKVLKAIHYANAVASSMKTRSNNTPAAEISASFKSQSNDAFITLLSIALPAWVTYNLVKAATSCLTAETTNQITPLTRNLVRGLSEVFCLTDPNRADTPIIYASQEFYRLTGYGRSEVIGYNCRFLQGPKTSRESVQRLRTAITNGEEICETLLNYRRDGTPFVNVLMLAPLLDDKGKVKYYLGAQVDASRLVEGGRGLDGFERFLVRREIESRRRHKEEVDPKQVALAKLRDLSMSFDLEESAVVQTNSRRNSMTSSRDDDTSARSANGQLSGRRIILDDETTSENDNEYGSDDEKGLNASAWNLSRDLPSGKLPGIYRKYVLIRPFPSLRTIFVSQAARKLGNIQQHPFLAHVAAPPPTISGLLESFESLTPVTAKVALMAEMSKNKTGTVTEKWGKTGGNPEKFGKVYWISATPLLDAENNAGVWMVVIIDKTTAAGDTIHILDTRLKNEERSRENETTDASHTPETLYQLKQRAQKDSPIKPKPVGALTSPLTIPLHEKVVQASTPDEYGYSADSGVVGVMKEKSTHRSESAGAEDLYLDADANNSSTECPNGSLVPESPSNPSYRQIEKQGRDRSLREKRGRGVTPVTPPVGIRDDVASEITPTRSVRSGTGSMDVGLRAMDYLTRQRLGQKSDRENMDVNLVSPYSVD